MNYPITFNDTNTICPITFGYIKPNPNNYNFNIEYSNLQRKLYPPNGLIKAIEFKDNRVGQSFTNYNGSNVECIEYIKHNEIYLKIISHELDGETKTYLKQTYSKTLQTKTVKSIFDKSIGNSAYIGFGIYKKEYDIQMYNIYKDIIRRTHNQKWKEQNITYKDCTLDPRWLNYQNFSKWYIENRYIFNEPLNLDKDILYKRNKIYGPNTCIFVPSYINMIFTKRDALRGDLPIGVVKEEKNSKNKYRARLRTIENGSIDLGSHSTPEDAFYVYKEAKEKEIKKVADIYMYEKGGINIPQFHKIYQAMYDYQVEITD